MRGTAKRLGLACCAALALASCGDDSGGPGPEEDATLFDGGGAGDDAAGVADAPPCQGATCSCPTPQESHCGDVCEGPENGCLCACGGGGDFTSCGCVGGFLDCPSPC
jgi:hypothetical protein